MSLKKTKPDYAIAVNSARSSRISNAVMCTLGCVLLVIAFVIVCLIYNKYVWLAVSIVVTLLIPLVALLIKNLVEVKAIEGIAKTGTFAAKLTEIQQSDIRANLVRQGRHFYLLSFLAIATPEAAVLIIMSTVLESELFLLIMAIFALASISIAMLASLYLGARLKIKNAFATVSSKGVLTSREVLPFDAKRGDVISLIRFDDYYRIEFVKKEILGISHKASVLVPVDGVLKNGILSDNPDEVVAKTLGLRRITVIHSDFYESRDYSENTVNALASHGIHSAKA